ncbi:MAG TPA: cytochrome P450 [Ktedonobacteraceae bacterium]|nr:cytochrome P450 [Ktedonobacteraceae bacterium]
MTQTDESQPKMAFHLMEHLENPFPFYQELRDQETIVFSPDIQAWLVPHYEDVRAILSQPDIFSSHDFTRPLPLAPAALEVLAQGYPVVPVAIDSDGMEHRRRREPHLKGFSAAGVKAREQSIRDTANRLVDTFIDDGHAEIVSQFAYPFSLVTVLNLLGIPQDRLPEVKGWVINMVNLLFGNVRTDEEQVASARGFVAFQKYIAELIEQRRANPQNDELDALINYQVPGEQPLSPIELISAAMGFLAAGHRSTLDVCTNAFALLLKNPALWQDLCANPDLIPSAAEEVLRYEGSVQTLFRVTTQGVEIRGTKLPAGTRVVLLLGSANRDEAQFPDPHVFDPQRTPNRHVSFGHGVHFCVGAPLGRLEIRLVLETFTRRLPALRLAPDQQLVHNPTILFRGYDKLLVEW